MYGDGIWLCRQLNSYRNTVRSDFSNRWDSFTPRIEELRNSDTLLQLYHQKAA